MANILKRGAVYYLDFVSGGKRLRCSLGTRLPQAAKTLARQIETTRASGPESEIWGTLRTVLPPASFEKVSTGFNLTASPALLDFAKRFEDRLDRRVKLGEIAEGSRNLYGKTAWGFFQRMSDLGVRKLDEITPRIAEEFIIWKKEAILAKGGSGSGVGTVVSALHAVFNYALEEAVIKESPLKNKHKISTTKTGAKPFSEEELARLEENLSDADRLPYLLLRWAGLRGSDAVSVTWSSVDWAKGTLTWLTKKRRTWVTIPLKEELRRALSARFADHKVQGYPEHPILLGISRDKLYKLIGDLGKRAGVENCHPHRFRHTLACSLLAGGATLFDVAKLLGDSHTTVEKYYAAVTDKQQQRVREILEK